MIVPVPIINHKRQHVGKKYDGDVKFTTGETTSTSIPRMLYVPQSMHNTLANMKSGLRDNQLNLDRPNQINVNTSHNYHQRLRHINQLVLNYNEEDRFLYLYGTYLWYLFDEPGIADVDFPRWCLEVYTKHERINDLYAAQDVEKNSIDSNHEYERILGIANGVIGIHSKNSQPVGSEFLRFWHHECAIRYS